MSAGVAAQRLVCLWQLLLACRQEWSGYSLLSLVCGGCQRARAGLNCHVVWARGRKQSMYCGLSR